MIITKEIELKIDNISKLNHLIQDIAFNTIKDLANLFIDEWFVYGIEGQYTEYLKYLPEIIDSNNTRKNVSILDFSSEGIKIDMISFWSNVNEIDQRTNILRNRFGINTKIIFTKNNITSL